MEIKQLLKPALLAFIGAVVILYSTGHTQEVVQDETISFQSTVIDEIKKDTEQFSFPVVLNDSIILNSVSIYDGVINFNFILDKEQADISVEELHETINEVFNEKKEECKVKDGVVSTVQFNFNFHYLRGNTNTIITKPLSFMCGKNINLI